MESQMTQAELEKIHVEISKLIAETAKINAEARWYPFVAIAGLFAAAFAVAKFFLQ